MAAYNEGGVFLLSLSYREILEYHRICCENYLKKYQGINENVTKATKSSFVKSTDIKALPEELLQISNNASNVDNAYSIDDVYNTDNAGNVADANYTNDNELYKCCRYYR